MGEYEYKMISSGNNYPEVDITKKNLIELCVLLHEKCTLEEIKQHFQWSHEELTNRLELLMKEDLIRFIDERYIPNMMIISLIEGNKLYENMDKIAYSVYVLIKENLNKIKEETFRIEALKKFEFEKISLFILSNIIMDSIQIDNVEELFLKTTRTAHKDKNYYFSLQEKVPGAEEEAFGIYGNMIREYGNICYGLYGKFRSGINFHTIMDDYINKNFCDTLGESLNLKKSFLLSEMIKYHQDKNYEIKPSYIDAFNALEIMEGKSIDVPIFSMEEYDELYNIANIIRKPYIRILEENRLALQEQYIKSIYSEEISFAEYFIWWYHLLYSRVTEMLIEKGLISIPKGGNFSYIVK